MCLSYIHTFTASVGTPRVAAIERPGSQPLGPAGAHDEQREVLLSGLRVLEDADKPGTTVHLPQRWPEGRRARRGPRKPPPITTAIKRKPWLLYNLVRRRFPAPDSPT